MNKNQKTKKGLLEELTALRQELERVQSTQAEIQKEKESLEKKGDFFFNIFSAIREGISVLDPEMNILFVNPTIERWNPHVQSFVGRKCFEAFHGRSQRCELCPCFETLQTGQTAKETLPSLDAKGVINGWAQHFSYPLMNSQTGELIGVIEYIRNITEQKQTEEALSASEEKYRAILENLADGYYEVDLAGNLTYFNDALAKTFGYDRAQLMGMNNRTFTDDQNAKKMYQAFNRVYRSGEPAEGVRIETITQEKNRRNLELSISLIRDVSGKPLGFRGIVRDITDPIKMQNALRESEERYRTIIETIEDGYFEVDLKGSLTYFNDTLVRIHEYPRVELAGMNNRHYTDAENAKILYQAFNRVYRTGEPSKGTYYEIITKSGGRKNLESSVSLIRDLKGNPVGFRGIVRDVTELKQAQKALQSSEERFRIAAESTNDFIYEWDLKSGQLEWFGNVVEKLGFILGELPLTITDWEKLTHPEDRERLSKAVRRHLKEGDPFAEEYRMIGKDGNIVHVTGAGMGLRDGTGRAIKWIGALSDISERKNGEEELKQSFEKVRKAMGGIIQAMALTVESKDPYTAGHQQRVSSLARRIAQEMGLSKDQVEAIRLAGVVHDLGKISVPAEILSKPTKLSDLEFSLIKGHSQTSYEILKDIDFPWPIALIALQHHERMNGSGYPAGLKGDEILIEAQVLMVADVVEAIASHRPYRAALGIDLALEEISINKGELFNPAVVDACLRLFREKSFSLDKFPFPIVGP